MSRSVQQIADAIEGIKFAMESRGLPANSPLNLAAMDAMKWAIDESFGAAKMLFNYCEMLGRSRREGRAVSVCPGLRSPVARRITVEVLESNEMIVYENGRDTREMTFDEALSQLATMLMPPRMVGGQFAMRTPQEWAELHASEARRFAEITDDVIEPPETVPA